VPAEIIQTEGLSKSFRGRAAVSKLDLRVAPGSVYAFLGPNGAGKSTTIRMLLGLLRSDAGRIALFGLPLKAHRRSILQRTGSLVETPSIYPHLTARENLDIGRRILSAPRSDIDRVLAVVGLSQTGRKLVRHFSLGMRQRLGLAQALLGSRELLILDEPTNGLDPAGITEVRELIKQLPREHGITVFLSSHLLSEVEQTATHVGILSQGALVFQGDVAELSGLRRSRLRIGLSRPDDALALLTARGFAVEVSRDALVVAELGAAARINRLLVEAGHEVHHLAVESASLEDVFLGLTKADMS